MRCFVLRRDEDETGVSGTGYVAEGVVFLDGRVAMRWCVPDAPTSTATYDSIGDVEKIHGHGGKTVVEFQTLIPEARPDPSSLDEFWRVVLSHVPVEEPR